MLEVEQRLKANAIEIKLVRLRNFRNYGAAAVPVGAGKTILIGENAQGKSNFLEAIEVAGSGRSRRAAQDADLIAWGEKQMSVEVSFRRLGEDEQVFFAISRQPGASRVGGRQVKVNGVSHSSARALIGHLVTVGFASQDLNLIRGGPAYRREWMDGIILRLRPSFHDVLSSYAKVVVQRNRLLKTLYEKGRVAVADQDQLLVWDRQLARFGSQIVKARVRLLTELLPGAREFQSHLSGQKERLEADYVFRSLEGREESEDGQLLVAEPTGRDCLAAESLSRYQEEEIAGLLSRMLKERRGEEIARRQTLVGPHRDDVSLRLNGVSAVTFASQGQQRSLVLALKVAELRRLTAAAGESPVLLLDDVLAELDCGRQRLLMSAFSPQAQTIITTTHLAGFEPEWLEDATIYSVARGEVEAVDRGRV